MIFHRITIENLFSYRGEHTFEFLRETEASPPVHLVLGRNGFGKTSLLNAVKLLFLGSEDKDQRQVGFPSRHLRQREYLLGNKSAWDGILNRDAKALGESRCAVSAEIGPIDRVSVTAKRSWEILDDDFQETLELNVDGDPFAGESAETRLDELLPRELVPFFFFDGEEIQHLAEGSDIKRADAMERLLSLSFINGVESELSNLSKEWRRESFPEDVQAKIKESDGKLEALNTKSEGDKKKDRDFSERIEELEDRSSKYHHQMEILRDNSADESVENKMQRIKDSEGRLETQQSNLAYELAADAPLIANPSLLSTAIEPLRKAIDQKAKTSQSIVLALVDGLPKRLLEEPPQPRQKLTSEQQEFYAAKLQKILQTYNVEEKSDEPLYPGLDYSRASKLWELLLGVNSVVNDRRRDRARRLREISMENTSLEKLRSDYKEAQFVDSNAVEQHRELEQKYADTQQELGRDQADRAHVQKQLGQYEKQKEDLLREIKSLEKEFSEAGKTRRKVEVAEGLRKSFRDYRRKSRETKRQEIEVAVNIHFRALMTGHGMISRIQISDDFFLKFVDSEGQSIGYSTISPGMRQLAVTALLWALKDVSGKSFPIIVDTPLARIDSENQDNLLSHYYPSAADQVIVLATDSEIDERKFNVLRPNLGQIYRLENPSGSQTQVKKMNLTKQNAVKWKDIAYG